MLSSTGKIKVMGQNMSGVWAMRGGSTLISESTLDKKTCAKSE